MTKSTEQKIKKQIDKVIANQAKINSIEPRAYFQYQLQHQFNLAKMAKQKYIKFDNLLIVSRKKNKDNYQKKNREIPVASNRQKILN